jgi:predicted GNAT family acetyltransferase
MKRELARVSIDDAEVSVTIDVEQRRFEMGVNGAVGFITLQMRDDVLSLLHTEVAASLRGKGVGGALARAALDYARQKGLQVEPYCPFVSAYIRRHPEYRDVIAP